MGHTAVSCISIAVLLGVTCAGSAAAEPAPGHHDLKLTTLDRQPREGRAKPGAESLAAMKKAVVDNPEDRGKRFGLVRGMMDAGDLQGALREAQAWRDKDAYNLVVVRLIGDLYSELGEKEKARRTYSAIVELVPRDAEAQRALATVLKQSGDLEGARERLVAALHVRSEDVRMAFELADVEQRTGRIDDATRRFEEIVAGARTPEAVRYPAKQRLAQIYSAKRRDALAHGDSALAATLAGQIDRLAIRGGSVNDIKIFLSWDTDRTDVDLWVESPTGEKIFYGAKEGKNGEALFDDVTSGYGPESFTAKNAHPGAYTVKVNYYSGRRTAFNEARGEVVIVLHEGTAEEERRVLPYRLFEEKQTVSVARIDVR